jgi:riboflavin synthase
MGRVHSIRHGSRSARLIIKADVVLPGVKLGDSIAVNGVCLTVTEFNASTFVVDVMAETLKRTNLGRLVPGDRVNLERALRVGDRLGGHIVSGHIDGVGSILREEKQDIARIIEISAPPGVARYTIEKGSITVDGISLTIVSVTDHSFTLSLIPHTANMTTLGFKGVGDTVNLEADIIGKYVERLLGRGRLGEFGEINEAQTDSHFPDATGSTVAGGGLTLEMLVKSGFLE